LLFFLQFPDSEFPSHTLPRLIKYTEDRHINKTVYSRTYDIYTGSSLRPKPHKCGTWNNAPPCSQLFKGSVVINNNEERTRTRRRRRRKRKGVFKADAVNECCCFVFLVPTRNVV